MNELLAIIALTLVVGVILEADAAIEAKRRHNEMIGLLNDLATMLGELFEHKSNKE